MEGGGFFEKDEEDAQLKEGARAAEDIFLEGGEGGGELKVS